MGLSHLHEIEISSGMNILALYQTYIVKGGDFLPINHDFRR